MNKNRCTDAHTCSFYIHRASAFTTTFAQAREWTPDERNSLSLFLCLPLLREGMRALQSAPSHSSAGLCHVAFAGDHI